MIKVKSLMTKNSICVDHIDKVFHVAFLMKIKKIGSALVKKNNKLVGIITERDIIRNCMSKRKNIFNQTAGDIMSSPIIRISENIDILEAAKIMSNYHIKKIVVNKDDILTMTDIIDSMSRLNKRIKVKDIMAKQVYHVNNNTRLTKVARIMNKNKIGSILVKNKNTFCGILTERDIVMNCAVGKDNFMKLKADDIMSTPLLTIEPEDSASKAILLMQKKRVKKIPVKSNRIIGIITQTDIIKNIDKLV